MESKTYQLLVNFDSKKPYCIIVVCSSISKDLIPKIASLALSRYNSIHSTTFELQKCSLFLTDQNDTDSVPIELFDDTKDYELVIRLPDFEPFQPKVNIPLEDDEAFYKSAKEKIQSRNFYSAYTFASYSPGHIDELAEKISESIYAGLLPAETHDFKFVKKQSFEYNQLIKNCEENVDKIMIFRKYCLLLAKISPQAAIKLIMNYPTTLKILPEFCQTEETFEFVLSEINQLCITQAGFKYFSDLFFNYGFVDQSIRIHNSIDIPAEASEKEFRAYCWKLFLLFDLNKLHQALVIYFRLHRNLAIGTVRCDRAYAYLCDVYSGVSTSESSFNGQSSQLEYSSEKSHPDLCNIFYMAGILMFYTGMYDHFADMLQCSPTSDPVTLLKQKPSAREWKIGRSILLNQGWGCEAMPKNRMHCTLCDYRPYKENFICYNLKRPHDVYMLSHVSFYELAAPEPSFAKKCFWNLIDVASKYKSITIMNGNYDVKVIIPHLMQYLVFPTVHDAIKAVAQSVAKVLTQVHEYLPSMPLYFVELEQYDREGNIVMHLNDEIKKVLPDFVEFREIPNEEETPIDNSSYYGRHFLQ